MHINYFTEDGQFVSWFCAPVIANNASGKYRAFHRQLQPLPTASTKNFTRQPMRKPVQAAVAPVKLRLPMLAKNNFQSPLLSVTNDRLVNAVSRETYKSHCCIPMASVNVHSAWAECQQFSVATCNGPTLIQGWHWAVESTYLIVRHRSRLVERWRLTPSFWVLVSKPINSDYTVTA